VTLTCNSGGLGWRWRAPRRTCWPLLKRVGKTPCGRANIILHPDIVMLAAADGPPNRGESRA